MIHIWLARHTITSLFNSPVESIRADESYISNLTFEMGKCWG